MISRFVTAGLLAAALLTGQPAAAGANGPFGPLHQYLYATAPYPWLQDQIIHCESGFDPGAYNGWSGASGLAQFLPSTFYDAEEAYGIYGSIWDPYTQIDVMNAMIRDGRVGEWSCYWIIVYGYNPD